MSCGNKKIRLDILDRENLGRVSAYFIMIEYRTYEVAILCRSNTIYVCTCDITQAILKNIYRK